MATPPDRAPLLPLTIAPKRLGKTNASSMETPDWKEHCSIDEDEHPIQRQAWRGGWLYYWEQKKNGEVSSATPDWEEVQGKVDSAMLPVWSLGYSTAYRVDHNH